MKTLNNAEMKRFNEFKHLATGDNDGIATWSVQYAENGFASDNFNGSYDEAKAEAIRYKENGCEEVRIALITLDENGTDVFTNEIEEV